MPIGIFDSGFGGLTVFREIRQLMPQYDYIYLGDNARAPYGSRSFETVYRFTRQAVGYLFLHDCPLVILACNTASAKALRTIQQCDLPAMDDPSRRVLGVIRPTTEEIGHITQTRHVGVLGTVGTIQSESYSLEIAKLWPDVVVTGHACPLWVSLVENGVHHSDAADFFVRKEIEALLQKNAAIDTIILACTHYPLLMEKIRRFTPSHIQLFSQGEHVATSLHHYLERHPEIESRCSRNATTRFLTTDSPVRFSAAASLFLGEQIEAEQVFVESLTC